MRNARETISGSFGVEAEVTESSRTHFRATLFAPADLPYLRGHFPDLPTVPGMLVVDLVLELIRIMMPSVGASAELVLVRFHCPLMPEELLLLTCETSPSLMEATLTGTIGDREFCTIVVGRSEECGGYNA